MRCSRDADPDVRVKIAECLGELGAIDPGRLDLSAVAKDTKPIRMYEVSQRLLARQLYLQLLLIGASSIACVSLFLLLQSTVFMCQRWSGIIPLALQWNALCVSPSLPFLHRSTLPD